MRTSIGRCEGTTGSGASVRSICAAWIVGGSASHSDASAMHLSCVHTHHMDVWTLSRGHNRGAAHRGPVSETRPLAGRQPGTSLSSTWWVLLRYSAIEKHKTPLKSTGLQADLTVKRAARDFVRYIAPSAKIKGHRDGTAYGATRIVTRNSATHHMRVLSLAIASSVGESIVQHARPVKSDLTAHGRPPRLATTTSGAPPHSPRPALEDILERRP